ncbi:hypothetical protein NOC27_989 [Nitrosococcus oceani AFC27]|nr:hypothetical protein NOC27_989 [Nitrosococcus oceani AFC27]
MIIWYFKPIIFQNGLEKLNYELPNKTNVLGPLPSVAAGDRRRWAMREEDECK